MHGTPSVTPKPTNLVRTQPWNYTGMSRSLSENSTGNMDLQDYMTGVKYTTTSCSLQVTLPLAPRFYGLPKIHKANCPMHPIVSACGTATYQLAKFLTKILQRYTGITPILCQRQQELQWPPQDQWKISGEEELVSFDISALIHQHPSSHSLRHHQQAVHWTHWGPRS